MQQRAALPPFLVLALTLVLTLELVQDSASQPYLSWITMFWKNLFGGYVYISFLLLLLLLLLLRGSFYNMWGPARAKTFKICGNRLKSGIFEAKSGIFEAKSEIFEAKSVIFEAKSGIFEAKRPKPNPRTQKSIKNPLQIHSQTHIFIYFWPHIIKASPYYYHYSRELIRG